MNRCISIFWPAVIHSDGSESNGWRPWDMIYRHQASVSYQNKQPRVSSLKRRDVSRPLMGRNAPSSPLLSKRKTQCRGDSCFPLLSLSLFGHLPSRNLCFVALETMREAVFSELRDQDTMDEVFKFFKWGLDKKVCDGEE